MKIRSNLSSVEIKQRDFLFNAIKKIATDKRTPAWISDYFRNAVVEVKKLKDCISVSSPVDENKYLNDERITVGDRCKNIDEKDSCVYEIINFVTKIDEIRLFDVKIVKGNAKNPPGAIIYNCPETRLKKIA